MSEKSIREFQSLHQNMIQKTSFQCQEMLIYKEVCRDLPECEARYYQPQRNSFDPFPADANSYTPWSARGLESGKKEI